MSTVPPGRYGSEDFKLNARIDAIQDNAPLEFDTLSEVAAELQSLRTQIAAQISNNFPLTVQYIFWVSFKTSKVAQVLLVGLLIEAIKEQNIEINKMKKEIEDLKG